MNNSCPQKQQEVSFSKSSRSRFLSEECHTLKEILVVINSQLGRINISNLFLELSILPTEWAILDKSHFNDDDYK